MQPRFRHLICAGYWLALVLATHAPPSTIKVPANWSDKLLHVLAFMLLGLLAMWALRPRRRKRMLLLTAVLLAYSAADECTQAWTGRTPQWADWVSNLLGLALGIGLAAAWRHWRQRGLTDWARRCAHPAGPPCDSPDSG